jgi:hypothetical protein
MSGALPGWKVLSAIRRHLGKGGLIRNFLSSLPEAIEADCPKSFA